MGKINSKLTLIIDGNWLLMSRMPVLHNRYADDLTVMKEAKLLMVKSINVVLRTFPQIDNIIFVADGGSWRTTVPIPEFLKNKDGSETEYKGNREKTDDINWDIVFHEYNDMLDVMTRCGINVVHEEGIEGDDWCWYWSRKMNDLGTNVMIWSKDRDLTQLVQRTQNGYFTVVWNKDNGLFIEDEDLTNMLLNPYYQMNEKLLQEIVANSCDVIKADPERVRIDKIIRGDAGDNIMPAITRTPKNGKTDRIYKVMEKDLPNSLDFDSDDSILEYLDKLNDFPLYNGHIIETEDQIVEHIKYNRQLVVLDEKSYPENILAIMHKYDDWYDTHNTCIDMPKVESLLIADKNSIMSILDDI